MFDLKSKLQHNYSKIYRILLVIATLALMILISPRTPKFQYEFEQGFPWIDQPLYAPFSFAISKSEKELAAEKHQIRANSYLYFNMGHSTADSVKALFSRKAQLVFVNDTNTLIKNPNLFISQGKSIITSLYAKGIISNADSLQNKSPDFVIKTIEDHTEKQFEIQQFYTLSEAFDSVKSWTSGLPNENLLSITVLENVKSNINYNPKLTADILSQKMSVISSVYGMVNTGEKIVDKGDIVTPEIYAKLYSLQEASAKKTGDTESEWYIYGGIFIYVSFALMMLILVIKIFSPSTYSDTNSFTLILILFLLSYGMANIPRIFPGVAMYALPFALFAVVLQSFFRSSLASIVYMLMVFIGGVVANNGIEFLWIEIPSGLLAILLLNNLRKRSQFLGVIMVVIISSSLLYFASSIIKEGHLKNIEYENFGWFTASALLTVISIPLVLLIERVFGLISEMALLELSDTNNKLLRELAQIAPGTFQHSMQVANLAEECAVEIGGDALLIRTGALYHDIGKMKNPQYYIENQSGGHNPHSDLSEEESAKLIINHVIDGVEMAKKHKLPEKIIDFIRTHHGTTTTRYFLYHAKQKNPNVDSGIFQYPGPLPYSKETAILMLCDGVEAAARSLPEYSAETINKLIDGIFNTILDSHQLDYAPITFQNISVLKKLLQKKIMNIYHVRVAYPSA